MGTRNYTEEWKADARINKHDLDNEIERIGSLYEKWSLLEAEHIRKEDQAELQIGIIEDLLKEAKAKADLELRSWSVPRINKEFGLQLDPTRDLTEPAYKSLVLMHPGVQAASAELAQAKDNYIKIKHKRIVFKHARVSMSIKNESLERLAFLHERGWFVRDHTKTTRHHEAKAAYADRIRRERTKNGHSDKADGISD